MGKRQPHSSQVRIRKLTRDGWLTVMTRMEISMWLIYNDHADAEGVAFPSGQVIAGRLGHGADTHISETRGRLAKMGLLRVIEKGGGRGKPCKVQLVFPTASPILNPPINGRDLEALNPPESRVETLPISGVKPSRIEGAHNKEEVDIEVDNEVGTGGHVQTDQQPDPVATLDAEIRQYVERHPRLSNALLSSPRMQPMRDLVKDVGWTRAEGYVERAITHGANQPFDYALGIRRRELREGREVETHAGAGMKEGSWD